MEKFSIFKIVLPTMLVAGLAGCASSVISSRKPSAATQFVTVAPSTIPDVLHNPGMGFIFYCGNTCGNSIPPEADVLFASAQTWGAIETSRGNYDFSQIQGILNTARQTGRRIAIRVMSSFQNVQYPTPQWLTDPGHGGTVPLLTDAQPNTLEGNPNFIYEPEWWHPDYAPAFQKFVAALGRQFDGEPLLDFVDMRVYGWWNEGHRYHATVPWPANVDKRAFVIAQTQAYFNAFPDNPVVVETAQDAPQSPPALQYPSDTGIDFALSQGAWMRRDGFGAYISPVESQLLLANWRSRPVIAEPGSQYAQFLAGKVTNLEKTGHPVATIDDCVQDMLNHHINYFPMDGSADYAALKAARPDLVQLALTKTGYRFEVSQASWEAQSSAGGTIHLTSTWHNSGVGRLPFSKTVTAYLLDGAGNIVGQGQDLSLDLTTLINSTDQSSLILINIPPGTSAGNYQIAVAVTDPATNQPSISLGIGGNDGNRRYSWNGKRSVMAVFCPPQTEKPNFFCLTIFDFSR